MENYLERTRSFNPRREEPIIHSNSLLSVAECIVPVVTSTREKLHASNAMKTRQGIVKFIHLCSAYIGLLHFAKCILFLQSFVGYE